MAEGINLSAKPLLCSPLRTLRVSLCNKKIRTYAEKHREAQLVPIYRESYTEKNLRI
jgi:hypothetical protein